MTADRVKTLVVFAPHELVVGNREAFKALCIRLANEECNVIVDCRDTGYMDSGGLGVLVSLARHFARDRLSFVVCSVNDDLTELFALTKMDTMFHLADTIDDARQLLGVAPPTPPDEDDPPPTLTLHR